MLPLHVDSRLCIDQHFFRLKNLLIGPLRLLKRSRLNGIKMVVTGLRLFREAYCTSLTVPLRVSLHESTYGFMDHVTVQAAENLSSSNGIAG